MFCVICWLSVNFKVNHTKHVSTADDISISRALFHFTFESDACLNMGLGVAFMDSKINCLFNLKKSSNIMNIEY